MLCLVRKSLILLFKKRLFKTLYTMYSTVHSKATVTGHQIVPADRQLKIAQLGVCWEAPSFQESLEPHVTEDTSSGLESIKLESSTLERTSLTAHVWSFPSPSRSVEMARVELFFIDSSPAPSFPVVCSRGNSQNFK